MDKVRTKSECVLILGTSEQLDFLETAVEKLKKAGYMKAKLVRQDGFVIIEK